MKRVKIAKYTKEKRQKARDEYNKEQSKIKYKTFENMRYTLYELWKSQPIMLMLIVLHIFSNVAATLFDTFTSKYVVELALGTSSRIRLAVICLLLIVGEFMSKYIENETKDYRGYVGYFKFVHHMTRKMLRKHMSTDYENNESCDNNNLMQKARTGSDYITYQTVDTIEGFLMALIQLAAYGGILSMLDPIMILIVGVPAITVYYLERHKMKWIWNMADNWQQYDRELDYIGDAGRDFSSAKDVRIFGMDKWFTKIFDRSYANRLNWYEQQDEWTFRHNVVSTIILQLADLAAYAYVIYMVVKGNIGAGDFVLYFNSIWNFGHSVRVAFDKFSGFKWLSNNTSYARQYLDMPDKTNRGKGEKLPTGECELEFRNVSYKYSGADADNFDRERVYDCLKKAGLYDKVMSLPEKENTRLVKSVFENATELSGGQTQKLALARALYKDAPILLLDEPTAALDPIAEQEMYLKYADFTKGKSSVFISHRLASTRFCDRIIMIENGTLTETGTHAQLMAQGGKYAELFELQSSYYNDKGGADK